MRVLLPLAALCAALMLASLLIGPAGAGLAESLQALWSGDGALGLVMREIRAPRAVLGFMVGASLGLSGAAMQGYLRNPLAEPGLIGVSASAALGAVIALQTGFATAFALALPVAALAAALVAVGLIALMAGPGGGSLALILAGVAISALAGALTSLVLNLSPNPFAANEIVFWMMGSLADRSMLHVWTMLPFFGIGAALILGMLGIMAGLWAEKFDHMAVVTNFIIMPMTFLSGTFYLVDRLPEPFRTASHYNPFFYLIDGFRYGFIGHAEGSLLAGVGMTAGLVMALAFACLWMFETGYKLKT